jgi:membrane-associated phospholipid phosphatase
MKFNIHMLIDRSPELPYFILAVAYLLCEGTPKTVHIFAIAYVFLITAITIGLLLKTAFKTKRPKKHYNLPALRYDFPSLHSMVSAGTVIFAYYVNPVFAVILVPISLFYLYSRLKLKAHSIAGVLGGALIGIALGFAFGIMLGIIHFPEILELAFAIMFFCTPLLTTLFRMKYSKRIDF